MATGTTHTYDKQRERLQVMNPTADGQTVMENRYRYDAVDNIPWYYECCQPNVADETQQGKLGGREFAYV